MPTNRFSIVEGGGQEIYYTWLWGSDTSDEALSHFNIMDPDVKFPEPILIVKDDEFRQFLVTRTLLGVEAKDRIALHETAKTEVRGRD
jgi:hypothetical protein